MQRKTAQKPRARAAYATQDMANGHSGFEVPKSTFCLFSPVKLGKASALLL